MRIQTEIDLARSHVHNDIHTVRVLITSKRSAAEYTVTYKVLRRMNVSVGEHVVVPVAGQFQVGQVTEVNDKVKMTGDEPWDLKWVVQVVDFSEYHERVREDKELVDKLQEKRLTKQLTDSIELFHK